MQLHIRRYVAAPLSLLACALIFFVDLALPLGVAIWLAYLAVVAGVAWFGHRRLTYIVAALATLLIVIGFFRSPPGIAPWIAAVNRTGEIVLIWLAAFLVDGRRQLFRQVERQAADLSAANAQLELQAEELRAANELLEQQAEALTTANAQLEQQANQLAEANELLQNQAEELEVQAEELQSQNEELVTLAESLEQRVEERTAALRQANASLQGMSAKLVAVQENERQAISRELHDESGQVLTTMIIRLGLLRDLCAQGGSPFGAIDELKQLALQLAEGLHRLAVNLRPASLDRAGLLPALQQYVETYRDTYNLQVDLVANGFDDDRLAPDLESSLYRIVQEALTNAARHARAGYVSVVLNRWPDRITSVIEDDGIGFDAQAAARSGRLGLVGMQERAEMRGGSISIESRSGAGTTVFVEIPCPQNLPVPYASQPSEAS